MPAAKGQNEQKAGNKEEGEEGSKAQQSLFAKRRAKITGHAVELGEEQPKKRAKREPAAGQGEGSVERLRSTAGVWVNRAPVLVLWTAVVAQRQGHSWETGVTLGRAVSGLCAQAKGMRIGVMEAQERDDEEERERAEAGEAAGVRRLTVLGMQVKTLDVDGEPRAVKSGGKPENAGTAQGYLQRAFKERLEDVKAVLEALAASYDPEDLAREAFGLYEDFRPSIPEGQTGWGKPGLLDLEALEQRTRERQRSEQAS